MPRSVWAIIALFVAMASPVGAQGSSAVRSVTTASNGVQVTVYSDEFAGRYEYTSPSVDIPDGFLLIARVKTGDRAGPADLRGSIVYSDDSWRFYDNAIFRGGARAEFVSNGRDVISCRGSRSSRGCSYSESFIINITPDELRQHAQNGILALQLRSNRSTNTVMVEIPTTYFDAVNEVAGP